MLDLLCKVILRETVKAHIAKYFDRDAASWQFVKRKLTCSSFVAPNAMFVKHKVDIACMK